MYLIGNFIIEIKWIFNFFYHFWRFKVNNEITKLSNQSVLNMKKLLKYCKDISVYYKIAVKLDFKDVLNELSSKNYSSIINDLVSNKKISMN